MGVAPAYAEKADADLFSMPTCLFVGQDNPALLDVVNKYHKGGILSPVDSQLIEEIADTSGNIVEQSRLKNINVPGQDFSQSFSKTKSKYQSKIQYYGKVWHKGFVSYRFGGNVAAKVLSGKTPEKMKAIVKCDSYGFMPGKNNGPLTVSRSNKVSHTVKKQRTLNMDKSKVYSGYAIVRVVTTQVDVVSASGSSFTVVGI